MTITWPKGPLYPHLTPDAVHVWQAGLNVESRQLAVYEALLAEDEREQAARFRFDPHRNHYIASRGMLRVLLSRYLRQTPETIDISYSSYNKPLLTDSDLKFNVAHSGNLVLYAFCLIDAVGIDVEVERELTDALAIAERFFSPAERSILKSLPEEKRIPAFFRCWSRKEAFIKAIGEGLSYPLDAFDVTLAPDDPPRLMAIHGSAEEALAWSLYDISFTSNNHAALVVKRQGCTVQLWRFPS